MDRPHHLSPLCSSRTISLPDCEVAPRDGERESQPYQNRLKGTGTTQVVLFLRECIIKLHRQNCFADLAGLCRSLQSTHPSPFRLTIQGSMETVTGPGALPTILTGLPSSPMPLPELLPHQRAGLGGGRLKEQRSAAYLCRKTQAHLFICDFATITLPKYNNNRTIINPQI